MADPSPQKPSPSSEPSTAELSSPENVPLVFPSADRSDSPDAPSSPEPAALEEPSTSAGPSTAVPRRPKKTKRSNKISTFVQFQRELLSCIRKDHGSSEAFVQEFHEKKTCADQVNFIYDSMMRYDLMQDKYTKDVKNDKKAKKHRDKADHLLVTGQPAAALELYTRSIMKAESEEMLGMAYANRSAALAKLDLFEEALMDITRAFAHKYPQQLRRSVLERRDKILSKEIPKSPVYSFYQPTPEIPEEHRSSKYPTASRSVEVMLDETNRRRVYATKDIHVGEVICVEEPPVFAVQAAECYHCHECFQLCYNGLSCEFCCQSVYCSVACRERAFARYHQHECRILMSLKNVCGKHKACVLAVKLALLISDENDAPDLYRLEGGLYNKNVKAEVLTTAVAAAVMFYLLKTYTNRFSQTEDQAEDKFKDLLMRNVRICMVDGAGIDEMYPIKRNPESGEVDQQWLNYKTEIVACALYTFCSLMRHACCPNVFVHHHGIKRVIRAVRTIPKGQELFITYGPYYVDLPREDRRKRLKNKFKFFCNCRACEENWPQHDLEPYYVRKAEDLRFVMLLKQATVEIALRGIPRYIEIVHELESREPLSELTLTQKLLSYCYDLLGNKRTVP